MSLGLGEQLGLDALAAAAWSELGRLDGAGMFMELEALGKLGLDEMFEGIGNESEVSHDGGFSGLGQNEMPTPFP